MNQAHDVLDEMGLAEVGTYIEANWAGEVTALLQDGLSYAEVQCS